jgi:catechol 2,3-dioxygenase-like lactoylglutathione lyase family enzyme
MTPLSLWIPFEVRDLEVAIDFWERRLGLRRVEEWHDDSENAVVLEAAPGSLLEFVSNTDGRTNVPTGLTIALELPTWTDVDAEYQRLVAPATATAPRSPTSDLSPQSLSASAAGASVATQAPGARPPTVYPRGYYAFRLPDPHGVDVLIWSEAPSTTQSATNPTGSPDGRPQ